MPERTETSCGRGVSESLTAAPYRSAPANRHTRRRGWDSNPRNGLPLGRFQGACTSPLCDLARRGLVRSRAREHPDPSRPVRRAMARCVA